MRSAARPGAALAALLVCVSAAGCASGPEPFQQDFEAGRYEDAARTFADDSALQADPEAAYRMALLRAAPGGRLYDPPRAADMLNDWLERFPEHPDRGEVRLLLDLVLALQQIEDRLERTEGRFAVIDSLRRENLRLADTIAARDEQLDGLRAELRSVRQELERLKEIDLGQP